MLNRAGRNADLAYRMAQDACNERIRLMAEKRDGKMAATTSANESTRFQPSRPSKAAGEAGDPTPPHLR